MLNSASYDSQAAVSDVSRHIQSLIMSTPIPNEIGEEVLSRFHEMKLTRVAVRSSAPSEDSAQHTFAGQYDTYLNTTESVLLNRIRECWASAFTPRALLYRHRAALEPDPGSMAVIVQAMVDSHAAGVAFSVDPVSGDPQLMVIEAALGLGEHVVSGEVTPDRFEVRKDSLAITGRHLGSPQRSGSSSPSQTGAGPSLAFSPTQTQALPDGKVLELARLVLEAESHYKLAVDIEWAEADNRIYILQCRPITAAGPRASEPPASGLLQSIVDRGDWIYYVSRRFNWFLEGTQIGASQLPPQVEVLGFGLPMVNYLILNGDEYYLKSDLEDISSTLKSRFERDSDFFDKFAQSEFRVVEMLNTYRKSLMEMPLDHLSDSDLARAIDEFSVYYTKSFVSTLTRPDAYLEEDLKTRLRTDLDLSEAGARDAFNKIARCPPLGDLAYADEPLALLRIAKHIKESGEEVDTPSPESRALVHEHAARFGWLKNPYGEADVSFSVDEFLDRIRYLVSTDVNARIRGILETRTANEKEYRDVVASNRISGVTLRVCEATRKFIFLRTYTTEASDSLFYASKSTILKTASKRLGLSIEDLVMLSASEIARLLRGEVIPVRELIDARRLGFAIVWLNGAITTTFGREAVELQAEVARDYRRPSTQADEPGTVRGTPASPGVITGRAYVAQTADQLSNFRPGDVLVAGMTSPDYVGAMEKAGAFVTDEGGVTCHAAIIAREFRVPCVVGTVNATTIFRTGQVLEVDANQGVIRVVSGRDSTNDTNV